MTTPILARTPIVARTNSCPRTEVFLRGKPGHVLSGFCQNGGRTGLLYPRHALQQLPLWLQARFPNPLGDILVQLLDLRLQEAHVIHAVTDHPAVVITHLMPFQGRDHLWDLLLRTTFGKLRNLFRLGSAPQQRFQHQLARNAEQIREHVAELQATASAAASSPVARGSPVAE